MSGERPTHSGFAETVSYDGAVRQFPWHLHSMSESNPKGVENLRILYAELGAAVLRARHALGPGPGAMGDTREFLAADREVARLTRHIAAIQDSEVRTKSV
jgi:hypothetical protein